MKYPGAIFPIGTLVVNLIGCLLIGFLSAALAGSHVRYEYRTAVIAGVLLSACFGS